MPMLFCPGVIGNGPVSKCRRVAPVGTVSEMICVAGVTAGIVDVDADPDPEPVDAAGFELLPPQPAIAIAQTAKRHHDFPPNRRIRRD